LRSRPTRAIITFEKNHAPRTRNQQKLKNKISRSSLFLINLHKGKERDPLFSWTVSPQDKWGKVVTSDTISPHCVGETSDMLALVVGWCIADAKNKMLSRPPATAATLCGPQRRIPWRQDTRGIRGNGR
jgi:hypothetical protein